jgi:ATP-dependent RNA helicase DHX29
MQSKKLYAWEVGPVSNRALVLVGGDVLDVKVGCLMCMVLTPQVSAPSIQVDRKIRYRSDPKTALAIKILREQFHATISAQMRGKTMTSKKLEWFELGLRFIDVVQEAAPALVVA